MSNRVVRIGTRTSALALAQTEEVIALLRQAQPAIRVEIAPILPRGDRRKSAPLQSLGRGAFASELEEALARGEIDIAVHSAKDMRSTLPDGLRIAAFPPRKDARDAIVNKWGASFTDMPSGARLGTSSPRRAGQLLAARTDIAIIPVRGNVDTRLGRVGADGHDGAVLAAAGMERLGRLEEVSDFLDPALCLPDSGQGALAAETRADDAEMAELLAPIDDAPTRAAVTAERAFVEATGGGCRVPVAAYALPSADGDTLDILAMACLPDGSRVYRNRTSAAADDPAAAGLAAAAALAATGADAIMYAERAR